jgi:hypothetical protein
LRLTSNHLLSHLIQELDAFNATLNDENEDTPELLATQERLFAEIAGAEAATLSTLSAKELTAHFQKRAPGQHLPKWLAKAALIARINALPLLEPIPTPAPTAETEFSVAAYATAHGLDGRELRKKLRASGLRAPYTLEQVEKAVRQ